MSAPYPPSPGPVGYAPQPQFGSAPGMPQAAGCGPMPPEMHWAVVFILTWITFGLGALIWLFKEALFVKKIDPRSKAPALLGLALLCILVQVAVYFLMLSSGSLESAMAILGVIIILDIAMAIVALVAVFGMRSSLLRYYNTVEPIGLKLSGVMTFFFSILYFQYHFSRIAAWKKTGVLR